MILSAYIRVSQHNKYAVTYVFTDVQTLLTQQLRGMLPVLALSLLTTVFLFSPTGGERKVLMALGYGI